MAADVAELLWNKFLISLQQAEKESSLQSTLASHFQGIKESMKTQKKKSICSSKTEKISKLLYELNDILIECRIFAEQKALKKNWIRFNHITEIYFVRQRKKLLADIKKDFEEMGKDLEGQPCPLRNLPLISRIGEGSKSNTLVFEERVKNIENIICNDLEFKIVGICGMGGTGKTTLARELFSGEKVSNVFSKKIWICLSGIQRNEADIGTKIFKLVLEELNYDIDESIMRDLSTLEVLETLELLLSHERYLIVFDDVWPWHANFLVAEANPLVGLPRGCGAAVIVTSRLQAVARRIGGENLIHLELPLLKPDDCWKIFEHTIISGLHDEFELGFQKCLQKIESMLEEDGFKIIGICGVADAGKTTLARKVFDCASVSKEFSRKIWVSLSGIQRNERDIGSRIFKLALDDLDYDINESKMDELTMIELLETLELLLSNEKYLIVFDDVWPWHANFLAAETNLSGRLPRGCGDAVIVTCRQKEVARSSGCDRFIYLLPPDMEDCGKIFERTLGYDQKTWLRIKNEIIHKTCGLPSAAETLGKIFLDKLKNSEDASQVS